MYWHHMHRGMHAHRCGRASSRILWFLLGAGTTAWWKHHHDSHAWAEGRRCSRDRIPQNAYPAPGGQGPEMPPGSSDNGAPAPGTMDKWDRWGWGHWGRGSWPGQEDNNSRGGGWDRWGWNRTHSNSRPEGAWGPPTPLPGSRESAPEKDVVQQATDSIADLSEATLNNLLATVESLRNNIAEHRTQRERQERELQVLREAKFKQFEEWQRQQEQALKEEKKPESSRRLV